MNIILIIVIVCCFVFLVIYKNNARKLYKPFNEYDFQCTTCKRWRDNFNKEEFIPIPWTSSGKVVTCPQCWQKEYDARSHCDTCQCNQKDKKDL